MSKRLLTLLFVGAALAAALPSCQKRQEEEQLPLRWEEHEPEYVIAVVHDVSRSMYDRIQGCTLHLSVIMTSSRAKRFRLSSPFGGCASFHS